VAWRSQQLRDVHIEIVDDTAILTAVVTDTVHRDDHDQTFTMRLTQAWIRPHGEWVCLAGHAGPQTTEPQSTSQRTP
jgi:hypothetical protein